LFAQHHEKLVKEKKRTVKQLKKSIAQLMEKNETLLKELERLNVSVNERRHIHEISGRFTLNEKRVTGFVEFSLHGGTTSTHSKRP
jgi:3-oxoacyl-[acyl-carrier-protein] synthase III